MRRFLRVLFVLTLLTGIPVAVYLVGQATGFFGHAGGTPANLVIDASVTFPSNFTWKNLAQGGEEKGRMLASVVGKIAPLGINYVRIDHVFDMYDVVNKNGGQITFDWSKLDATISDITAMHAKPFISLSYMPPAISKTGDTVDLPTNWGDWEYVVQKTIEHISGTLGIDSVYYEVWNEPDLFGNFKTYGNKNYFDLYSHSVNGANRAVGVRPFKIGGPATTQLYQSWAQDFAKFILNNNLRLDFYSWHKYSMNLDNFENNAINARAWLLESGLPQNLELVVSEAGPNSNNDPVYDNSFGAIHTVAVAATLEDGVNKLFNFEIKDGPGTSKLWGRWGILTNDKFGAPEAKPRYNAFTFLNSMIGSGVKVTGQGSWVKSFAKTDGKKLRILIVNYDPEGKHIEAVPVNFVNLPTKNFEYKRINWGVGTDKDINVATSSSSWSTLELFNPNTASILEVTP